MQPKIINSFKRIEIIGYSNLLHIFLNPYWFQNPCVTRVPEHLRVLGRKKLKLPDPKKCSTPTPLLILLTSHKIQNTYYGLIYTTLNMHIT